jgi:hypothetical protein
VSTYVTNVAAARTSSQGIKTAAHQAAAAIPKVYADAGHSIDGVSGVLAKALGPGGAGGTIADLVRGAGATDVAETKQRLAESMAGALSDTKQRGVDAAAGEAYAVSNAGAVLETTRQKLNKQLVDLGGQRGAFTQGRLAELTSADAKARQTSHEKALGRRNSRLTGGVNPDGTIRKGGPKDPAVTGKGKDPAAKGLPKGTKPASNAEYRDFTSKVARAGSMISTFRAGAKGKLDGKSGRHKLGLLLQNGAPARPGHVDAGIYEAELKRGTDKSLARIRATVPGTPAVSAIDDPLAVSIALDMAYDKHVSRLNAKQLHANGMQLARIRGVVSYGDYVKRQQSTPPKLPRYRGGQPLGRRRGPIAGV